MLGAVSMIVSPDDLKIERHWFLAWIGANIGLLVATILVVAYEQGASELLRVLGGGAGI